MIISKLRARQCRRYVQPRNEDESEFSGFPATCTINRRDRKEFSFVNQSCESISVIGYLISDLHIVFSEYCLFDTLVAASPISM